MSSLHNILLVSNSGTVIGGGEISLYHLIRHLDPSRFRPFVAAPGEGELVGWVRALRVPVFLQEMPSLKGVSFLKVPSVVARLRRLARELEIDIIHANGSRCMIYAGMAGRLSGIPVVWHVRIQDTDRPLDFALASLARRIIVNSAAVAGRFGPKLRSRKVWVIHNGVDLREFDAGLSGEKIRREFGIGDRERLVTMVGRMDAWKGHRFFLRAAAEVLRQARDVRFLVVGDGALRRELEALAGALDIGERVVFTGNRGDIPEILAASQMLVSASISESFGRVIIEAMAMAKPVVGTAAGGVPEIVVDGETGLLVQPVQAHDMAAAILSMLADPAAAQRMGEAGLKRVRRHFRMEDHARRVEMCYASLLAGDPAAPEAVPKGRADQNG